MLYDRDWNAFNNKLKKCQFYLEGIMCSRISSRGNSPGRPRGEINVKLLKRKCGLKVTETITHLIYLWNNIP